jgi:hypothetical protein
MGDLADGGGAGAIGPNLARTPRKVWVRGDSGWRSLSIVLVRKIEEGASLFFRKVVLDGADAVRTGAYSPTSFHAERTAAASGLLAP